jgi:hypothetical protein
MEAPAFFVPSKLLSFREDLLGQFLVALVGKKKKGPEEEHTKGVNLRPQ